METIDNLVAKKNHLILELLDVLNQLQEEKVDLLCDSQLRKAVDNHPSLDLQD